MKKLGRPLKFPTPEALQEKIDAYFESIQDEHWKRTSTKEEVFKNGNPTGKFKDVWEPVYDRHGEIEIIFKEPPMITGLALFLDTTRETLMDYGGNPIFSDTISTAKGKIEKYYEEADEAPAVKIFKLKNFDWVDKKEVVTDQNINATLTAATQPMDVDDRVKQLMSARDEALLNAALQ